jgi:hypothetical protein
LTIESSAGEHPKRRLKPATTGVGAAGFLGEEGLQKHAFLRNEPDFFGEEF